ncbi:EAL domain-containing protein [Comamonas flocculans]|uniref:EAL domain-containing protein n=1 Tax=Comamonas flocculans TaxID=2597701 RepID=A0A5B8RW00_9BURK|nr:EAL domain-containing protein [Comamonas flocculans]QEA11967.1 EAL domain-containing protein [Comamonas flocculans]
MTLALIQGAALLLALCFLQSVLARLAIRRPWPGRVLSGLLFGSICIVGMYTPLQLAPGVFFDARSVVLAMAALFGGWLPALIATAMAASARIALGGGGLVVGSLVIVASSALGLLYRWASQQGYVGRGVAHYLAFGVLLHLLALALFQALEPATVAHVNSKLALPFLAVLAPATALLGWMLGDIERHLRTEASLAETAARLQAVTRSAPDLLMLIDVDGNYLEVMSSDATLATAPLSQLPGQNIDDQLPPEIARHVHEAITRAVQSGQAQTLQYTLMTPAGLRHFEGRCQPVGVPVRGRGAVVFIARDRTDQVHSEVLLRESEERFRSVLSNLPMVSVKGYLADGSITFWNGASEQLYGYTAGEVLGKDIVSLVVRPDTVARARAASARMFSTGSPIPPGEARVRRKDGSEVDVYASHALIQVQGQAPEAFSIDIDISVRKAAEERARYLAYFDALTGLPNRRLLVDRVQQVLLECRRNDSFAALFFLDLDHFKTLNDSHGHEAGDQVLTQTARRLQTSVREQDTVARLGGDEFVVLLPHLGSSDVPAPAVLRPLAEKLLAQLRRPYELQGQEQQLTASLGIALIDEHTTSVDELLKQADLAMYRAKDEGRNTLRFFDPHMQAAANARAGLQSRLHQALKHAQFELYYQPQVDEIGRIVGAEALLRWNDPVHGLVGPAQFIQLAEETGQIMEIGQWVLQAGMRQQAHWQTQADLRALSLSLNISARQFLQEGFVGELASLLARSGANPERLRLELTESVLLSNVQGVIEIMQQLRTLGLWLSLDDFGTGYSSLGYLKRLPLSELKIDQGFVRGILDNPTDAAIARSIITLADSLQLTVVAEGVETRAHHALLLDQGCRKFQGYLFGRPVPLADFEASVRAQL